MNDESGSIRLAVSAALVHQYSSESSEFLTYLVTILGTSMKERLSLKEKGLFKKTIQGLSVDIDDGKLNLDLLPNGSVSPSYTRIVRGIALRTENVSMEEWIELLSAFMEGLAKSSERSRNALAALIDLP